MKHLNKVQRAFSQLSKETELKINPSKNAPMRSGKDISHNGKSGYSQKDSLVDALFEQTKPPIKVDNETLTRRAHIAKAWGKLQCIRLHAQTSNEKALMLSKINAMQELAECSPTLAEMARKIDYNKIPGYRRIPTITPPNPEKSIF